MLNVKLSFFSVLGGGRVIIQTKLRNLEYILDQLSLITISRLKIVRDENYFSIFAPFYFKGIGIFFLKKLVLTLLILSIFSPK